VSEYQYYEFQAIDEALDEQQMAALRAISTRATITPTSFVNTYNWGDLKADPRALVATYFDAHLYVANWGTRRLLFRFPRRLVDEDAWSAFCGQETLTMTAEGDHVLLDFWSEDEDGDWESGEGWLSALIPLRADLLAGDLRSLYLGWLFCAESRELDADALEPSLPPGCPGLREASASLKALADFLRIDPDLFDVAAEGAPGDPHSPPSQDALAAWVRAFPEREKDALLLRLTEGEGPSLRWELLKRFRESLGPSEPTGSRGVARRSVAELLALRDGREREREQRLAKEKAERAARAAKASALARAKHLDDLAQREPQTWATIEALIRTRQPKKYDQAVALLADLRDLADRRKTSEAFRARLGQLIEPHRRKQTLLQRLERAGLEETR